MKKNVVIGMLGMSLDSGFRERRRHDWRPTVALFKHEMPIDRLELLYQPIQHVPQLKEIVSQDIREISPHTALKLHSIRFEDPWDFEEVYLKLYDFAKSYSWKPDEEDYFLHITTGTHVMQVCYFALTEANIIPAKLLQTGEDQSLKRSGAQDRSKGVMQVIDLKSERYQKIATRFAEQKQGNQELLKAGIATQNALYNSLISELEKIAQLSDEPILLSGETGVGKTELARRLFEIKNKSRQKMPRWQGKFIEVNCATLRGDLAMSTLFGHKKGAFTGAQYDRIGLLKEADGGLLFLDEIGELGADEQAILLRAIEDKIFRPLGAEKNVASDFILVAGTNRNLREDVKQGRFREDLLARIDVWEFHLPSLRERIEDLEPNISFELDRLSKERSKQVRFSSEALQAYLIFARTGVWSGNFRDLRASISRMSTFGIVSGLIDTKIVDQEIQRLKKKWQASERTNQESLGTYPLEEYCQNAKILKAMTLFERSEMQLILATMARCRNLKEAAETLFEGKANPTDSLRKKLLRYSIDPAAAKIRLHSNKI